MTYKLIPTQYKKGCSKIDAIRLLRENDKNMLINDCMNFLDENLNNTQLVDKHHNHYTLLHIAFDLEILEEIPDFYEIEAAERKKNTQKYEVAQQWLNTLTKEEQQHVEILIKMNQIPAPRG